MIYGLWWQSSSPSKGDPINPIPIEWQIKLIWPLSWQRSCKYCSLWLVVQFWVTHCTTMSTRSIPCSLPSCRPTRVPFIKSRPIIKYNKIPTISPARELLCNPISCPLLSTMTFSFISPIVGRIPTVSNPLHGHNCKEHTVQSNERNWNPIRFTLIFKSTRNRIQITIN